MGHRIDDHAEPACPICGMSMVLVRIDPRVASFSELRTFRCFACGDVRATEQERTLLKRVDARARLVTEA